MAIHCCMVYMQVIDLGISSMIPKKRLTESYMRIKKARLQDLELAIGGNGYPVGM